MTVESIAFCIGEMPDQQREKRCLALWLGRNFRGRTLSLGMSMAVSVYKKEDIVYVDKSGIDRHLHRRNARSAKGKKVFSFMAGKKFQRRNIVAGYANGETIAECIYNCTTDGEVFNAWVEQSLVAALKPRQVILMDNGAFHKHPRTREAIEAAGCSLIFLPPYFPDPNPIEKFWANLKGTLADILRLFPSLFDAIQYAFLK
jgi:transposase